MRNRVLIAVEVLAEDISPVTVDNPLATDGYGKDWLINDQQLSLWVRKSTAMLAGMK